MPHAPDDPRLTAFALGELEDADRPEIEALIRADPEALAFVEEVRDTARLLADHLRAEPAPGLAPEQHQAIETQLTAPPAPVVRPRPRRRRWAELAVAAGLLGLAATLAFPTYRSYRDAHRTVVTAQYFRESPSDLNSIRDTLPPVPLSTPRPLKRSESEQETLVGGTPAAPGLGRPVMRSSSLSSASSSSPAPSAGAESDRRLYEKQPARSDLGFRTPSESPPPASRPPIRPEATLGLSYKAAGPPMAQAPAPPVMVAGGLPAGLEAQVDQFGVDKDSAKLDDSAPLAAKPGAAPAEGSRGALPLPSKPGEVVEQETKRKAFARTLPEIAQDRLARLRDREKADGDAFPQIVDNPFLPVSENPLSTFSIDVDTASYANVRRFLNQDARPPRDAVRIEELVNYFPYSYPAPKAGEPFSVTCETARCPWDAGHRLVRIGLKGRAVDFDKRPPSNLVFLIDVSGSMQDLDKLPLLKAGMKLLVEQLGENDRVAIVVYAGTEGLALAPTRCDRKAEILSSLEQLQAGGSTNGGKGIGLAYKVAIENFIPGGTNRVILATDGDFNVGVTEGADLDRLIVQKRESRVFLSVLGFGQGNVKHDKLEGLADKGDGQYCYIDSIKEARKVLVEQVGGTLVAIAKDVKVQVQFDPDRTSSYRLIGYENRMLQARDFEDDRKDAGEIGSGHCVTALYEVVPPGQGGAQVVSNVVASRFAQQAAKGDAKLLEVRLRYKAPDGDVSRLITGPADDDGRDFVAASADFKFAAAVAGFGMLLRESPYKGTLTWPGLVELASGAQAVDPGGYRKEFLGLVRKAQAIDAR